MKKGKKRAAIFLDRDGTIIHHSNQFILRPTQMRILSGVPEAIHVLNKLGFLVIVITNQPVVSRGIVSPAGIKKLHRLLMDRLARRGAEIDGIYFCPHHPDGKIKPWGVKCACRKPEPGMVLQAIKEFNIDPKKSFMVGDGLIDALAGQRAGVKTIQVKTGPGHLRLDKMYKDTRPDFLTPNLISAVKIIKKIKKRT